MISCQPAVGMTNYTSMNGGSVQLLIETDYKRPDKWLERIKNATYRVRT